MRREWQLRTGGRRSAETRREIPRSLGARNSAPRRTVQSYRWSDHSDFGGNDLDNAEPERIVTEGLDQRQNDGDGQHKDGDLVHEGAQHDVAEQDYGEDHPG